MYTKDDYFDTDSYGMSQADYTAIRYKDNTIYQLDQVLSFIGCSRDASYDYEPNCYGGHITAKPNACVRYPYPDDFIDHHNFSITFIRDDMFKYGPDCFEMDLRDAWNSHYDILIDLFDLLVKWDHITDRLWLAGHCFYYEDMPPKTRRANDRFIAVRDRFNAEVQKALDEMCRIAEREIDGDYEFSETDECAEMWVDNMNDRARWKREQLIRKRKEQHERDFEDMVGQAAAFAAYEA